MTFKVSTSSTRRSLNTATKNAQNSMNKLSSGKRIDKASVDPAGLAVAIKMLSEADTLKAGTRNVSYGQSAAAIADGASQQLTGITTRMQELATQSANGTLSDSNRAALQTEFSELQEEANRIVSTTEFNGQQLLSGDGFSVQVGSDGSADSSIQIDNVDVEGALAAQNFNSFDISNASSARAAIDGLSSVIDKVSEVRGSLGAVSSRLEKAENNNISRELGLRESASRITDADIAFEVANLAKNNILQQASTALIAQAGRLNEDNVRRLLG